MNEERPMEEHKLIVEYIEDTLGPGTYHAEIDTSDNHLYITDVNSGSGFSYHMKEVCNETDYVGYIIARSFSKDPPASSGIIEV